MIRSQRPRARQVLEAASGAAFFMLFLTSEADARKLSVLYEFHQKSGYWPGGALAIDTQGNVYGTAVAGGKSGGGTIFEIKSGQERRLYSLGQDAASPAGGLILDSQNNLYGTTTSGGLNDNGTVFELTAGGTFTVLYKFGEGTDGDNPASNLLLQNGQLLGTTAHGGNRADCQGGCGTVFAVSQDGSSEQVLYAFQGGKDGFDPTAGLISDGKGDFFGTTEGGGGACSGAYCGTVFELTSDGKEKVLHRFEGYPDGEQPAGGVVTDAQGSLFGVTFLGGAGNSGALYKIASDGTESILYSFSNFADGAYPEGGLMIDNMGNLYGTTTAGGGGCKVVGHGLGCGTVYEVAPDGTERVLARLVHRHDPHFPASPLAMDSKGILYGAGISGGKRTRFCPLGCGVFFEIGR